MGLKLSDICLTGDEKPRKNLTQETELKSLNVQIQCLCKWKKLEKLLSYFCQCYGAAVNGVSYVSFWKGC